MTGARQQSWRAGGSVLAGLVALVLVFGGLGGWAATATLSGAVIASGRIEVERNRQLVQHPDGGIVREVLVQEGQAVSAGQVLIRLDSELLQSDLAVVEGQLFELIARRGRYEAERDDLARIAFDPILTISENLATSAPLTEGQNRLFAARKESEASARAQLEKRITQVGAQIDGLRAQQAATDAELALINGDLADQQSLLDRGLAQVSRVRALQREAANLQGRAGEIAASVAQAEGRITEIELQVIDLATRRREEATAMLRDLGYSELDLRERRRSLLVQLDRLEIRAPVAGMVYGLQVHGPQSVIRPADPVLSIVPRDRPLVIAAQVPVTEIDRLYPGQEVHLRFSSFDQRRTPELTGQITFISADAFVDQTKGGSFYRAEVRLLPGETGRLPSGLTLVPGMPVETYIQTGAHTPLDYLTKPIADAFARTFRDP